MDKAIRIYPWNYLFWMNKAQIQLELKDYRGALISSRKGTHLKHQYAEGLESQGMCYEYLEQPDSARICYLKAIDKYMKRLGKDPKNQFTRLNIALLYRFVGDSINSQNYLRSILN